jgi:hypothetical protein
MSGALVGRLAGLLESRMSRRSVFVRSVFVGSAVAVGGVDFVVKPQGAYAQICSCGDPACGCGSTCCEGFSEFCCVLNGGYNYCPSNTIMGGWWKADGSAYCSGPRYYMDCNATCACDNGCGGGYQFCDPGCDGRNCECAEGDCNNWVTGCFQFRYGQCNQDVNCIGRIVCRVVACIPPWQVDPTCTTTNAEDDSTADMNVSCNTAVPSPPKEETNMATPVFSSRPGQLDVLYVRDGTLFHDWIFVGQGSWGSESLQGRTGQTVKFPDQQPQWSVQDGQLWVTVQDTYGNTWAFAQTVPNGSGWGVNELP